MILEAKHEKTRKIFICPGLFFYSGNGESVVLLIEIKGGTRRIPDLL